MVKIHSTADVQSKKIGENSVIWQYSIILAGAIIGKNCNINCHVFIENDVIIGDNVTIKPGVQVWDGIRIGNGVFIGPNVTFINDKYPKSKHYPKYFQQTFIEDGVSIGAGAIILSGLTVGKNSMIGAGSVVTENIPHNELWYGNPAKFKRKIECNDQISGS